MGWLASKVSRYLSVLCLWLHHTTTVGLTSVLDREPLFEFNLSRHHVTSARSESQQPHTERSSRPGPEPSSLEADVSK